MNPDPAHRFGLSKTLMNVLRYSVKTQVVEPGSPYGFLKRYGPMPYNGSGTRTMTLPCNLCGCWHLDHGNTVNVAVALPGDPLYRQAGTYAKSAETTAIPRLARALIGTIHAAWYCGDIERYLDAMELLVIVERNVR